MKSNEAWPTATESLTIGPEGAGVATLLPPPGALSGPPPDRRLSGLLDHMKLTIEDLVALHEVRQGPWQEPAASPTPRAERARGDAPMPVLEGLGARAGRDRVLARGAWTSPLLPYTPSTHWSEWPRLHRFVDLSALGWAFVLAAVCWEAFAFAFNHYAGWGWDRGAFFFAWGLGILACGFYLRTTRKQPADSHLFLGLNALFLSVLTIVVVTR
jgi:hypothetical protein